MYLDMALEYMKAWKYNKKVIHRKSINGTTEVKKASFADDTDNEGSINSISSLGVAKDKYRIKGIKDMTDLIKQVSTTSPNRSLRYLAYDETGHFVKECPTQKSNCSPKRP